MNSGTVNIDDSLGNCYMFYSVPVIAEYKSKLIIVDDEIKRDHVYLITRTKADHFRDKKVYINISESSLKDFEM